MYISLTFYLATVVCLALSCEIPPEKTEVKDANVLRSTNIQVKILFETKFEKKGLVDIQFINKNVGWLTGDTDLYKTEDGGRTWHRLDLPLGLRTQIVTSTFLDKDAGWVVAQLVNDGENQFLEGFSPFILRTTNGGRQWLRGDLPVNSKIRKILFLDGEVGWLLGKKYVRNPNRNELALVLKTNDRGQSWEDISDSVNEQLIQPFGGLNEQINDFLVDSPDNMLLLSNDRKLFFRDGSDVFLIREFLSDKFRQVRIGADDYLTELNIVAKKMGKTPDKKIWISANLYDLTLHEWPVRGELLIEGENKSWTNFHLEGFNIADIKFISEREIVVCGFWNDNVRHSGSILLSRDRGQSWETVFTGKDDEKWTEMELLPEQVIAIGDKGTLVGIELVR